MAFRRRPSDAARWTRCPGSLAFTQNYPNTSTSFADEGTVAHWVREECLNLGFDAYDYIGAQMKLNGVTWTVDHEMADNLQFGIDELRSFEGKLFVEQHIDTTALVGLDADGKPQGGTLDAIVVGEKLWIQSDLKYGAGQPVQAVDNDQQLVYLHSFWHTVGRHISDAKDFLIIIDQPRHAAGGGYWPVTLDQLLEYGDSLKRCAKATEKPNAPLIPGEKQCLFCPAANVPGRPGGCPAHHEANAKLIDMKFEDLDEMEELGLDWQPPALETLSAERRAHIVRQKSSIEKWLEKLHADELATRISSGPAHGLKAVAGRRPAQKWRDDRTAEAYLEQQVKNREKIFTQKLISPSQSEKLLGLKKDQRLPSALVDRGEPKPVLVPEADKRPPLLTVDQRFDDETDETDQL